MDSEQIRWKRKPRCHRISAPDELGSLQGIPRNSDLRGGVNGMAYGVSPGLPGWARLWAEVGHGLDARYAGVFCARSHSSRISPQNAHIPDALWVHRKFCAPALA